MFWEIANSDFAYWLWEIPDGFATLCAGILAVVAGFAAAAVITFYANMADLDEISRESMSGPKMAGVTVEYITIRLRLMAANLAEALDGLNADQQRPIPDELDLSEFVAADGALMSDVT